ncbi:glycerate kinase [Shewanella salipaludis]|uniref:Glycerate kinase n=1 Tax=Shewanella salipaludis TaxID=2723052 RepID=A0A972FRM1_9GAMM|nr:glycerate kinase [Shewanella salipaludis]NMH64466.1 glycerate kinase [Shewanella salipaludis]
MKIVIAPDSFKESLSSAQAAAAIAQGLRQALPSAELQLLPVADGGEGTVQVMVDATRGRFISKEVTGPLGDRLMARYGILGKDGTAVIEMAAASGLQLVAKAERDPRLTGSRGTGELIIDALERGCRHIILGLGGSACNDAGAGMLQALGLRLLDARGRELAPGGAALARLARIETTELHPLLALCRFELACDVDNPLCGERGASAVFGPQKGATKAMVQELDKALGHFAECLVAGGFADMCDTPGAGAAGGMGLAAMAVFNAEVKSGVELVLAYTGLAEALREADLLITGEGCLDEQTLSGKAPLGVLKLALAQKVQVIGIAGSLGDGAEALLDAGMTAVFPIIPALCSEDVLLRHAEANLSHTARNIAATLGLGMRLAKPCQ